MTQTDWLRLGYFATETLERTYRTVIFLRTSTRFEIDQICNSNICAERGQSNILFFFREGLFINIIRLEKG